MAGDVELRFSYFSADVSNGGYLMSAAVRADSDAAPAVAVTILPGMMALRECDAANSYTTLDYDAAATTAQDTWYDVIMKIDDNHCEVWRGLSGQTPALVLSTSNVSQTATAIVGFVTAPGARFGVDNVVLTANEPETTTYTCNVANQLTEMVADGVTTTFTYDAWGRLSTKSATIGGVARTATYGWRFGDKLKDVTTNFPDETTTAYNYDGLGKRRFRCTDWGGANPQTTWWRWDLGYAPLCEYADPDADWDLEGFAQFNVYNGLMHPLAEAAVSTTPADAAYTYLALDHLSSTRAAYDQSKTAVTGLEFYPYGDALSETGTYAPDARFTAKSYDPETGLYYFPYRYYSPDAGRWTKTDPMGIEDGPNVYGYLGGDIINMIDPDGLACVMPCMSYYDDKGVYHHVCGKCKELPCDCEDRCHASAKLLKKACDQLKEKAAQSICKAKIKDWLQSCLLSCDLEDTPPKPRRRWWWFW